VTIYGSEVLLNTQIKKGRWRLRKWFFSRLCNKATGIFAISEYTKSLLTKAGVYSERITVIAVGIDLKKFSDKIETSKIKKQLGINGEKVILTLARLHPRKGHDMVIRAMPEVLKEVPETRYVIAGTGDYHNRLVQLVHEHNLHDNVIFSGHVPDDRIIEYYDLSDVFVMPSRQEGHSVEGFGISFLEASARGKPAIGGNHGGVPEAIIDGQTGLVVNPHSPKEIAEAIIKLLSDKEYAEELGQRGRQRCFASLGWENITRKMLELMKCR